jgi:hypothetical protein
MDGTLSFYMFCSESRLVIVFENRAGRKIFVLLIGINQAWTEGITCQATWQLLHLRQICVEVIKEFELSLRFGLSVKLASGLLHTATVILCCRNL